MRHVNMLHDVVAGLQEVLQEEPFPIKASVVMQEPKVSHVANSIQDM